MPVSMVKVVSFFLYGFDPRVDYKGIVKDELERRVDFIEPTNSLFLMKPTMRTLTVDGDSRKVP